VGVPNALEEFYAIGLRNPYRMSLDSKTGQIWVFDPGDASREEVNLLQKGANYQYPFREGTLAGPDPRPAVVLGEEQGPFFEYGRDLGSCVTGGVVYRGREFADILSGWLVFADIHGAIYRLNPQDPVAGARLIARIPQDWSITSVNEDAQGELLFCNIQNGLLWRLVRPQGTGSTLPALLSQTGAFADAGRLQPAAALLPYEVNSPLWSDGARKIRWMALPQDGEASRIRRLPDGQWRYPAGTVFVKHFEIQTNHMEPASVRRLETRLLVIQTNGAAYGVTYRWRPDGQDAEVLPAGGSEELTITTPDGIVRQTWQYPSMSECLMCHTKAAGYVLGVTAAQLNRPAPASGPGTPSNQLQLLNSLGLLDPPLTDAEPAASPSLPDPADANVSLTSRVRSYLESNCSSCHRPGGVRAQFDARFVIPPDEQNLILGPVADSLGRPGTRVVVPGDQQLSALYQRLVTVDGHRMPPLGRNTVDPLAATLFRDWILSLPTIQLLTPVPDSRLEEGPLVVTAEVANAGSGIRHVEFQINGVTVGTRAAPPYRMGFDRLGDGHYEVMALARTKDGAAVPSQRARVELIRGRPTVRLSGPPVGAVFEGPLSLAVEAHGGGEAGIIRIVLRMDGAEVGMVEGSRGTVILPSLSTGEHLFQADAVDSTGRYRSSEWLAVQVVPRPHFLWRDADSSGILMIPQTNLVDSILSVGRAESRWVAAYGFMEGMATGVADPWGGFQALRMPDGAAGQTNPPVSGLLFSPLAPVATGTYVVSVFARSESGGIPIGFGLTEAHDQPGAISESWQRFIGVYRYQSCDCHRDWRIFQIFEGAETNSAWSIALPETFRVEPRSLFLDLADQGAGIREVRAYLGDSMRLETADYGRSFQLPPLPSGVYPLRLEIHTSSGLVARPDPTTLVVGPRLEVAIPSEGNSVSEGVRVRGVQGSRVMLQFSRDLIHWTDGPIRVLKGPEAVVKGADLGDDTSKSLLIRAVLLPLERF
jgi:uncharacterized repeat protein (TIGR03806 family)